MALLYAFFFTSGATALVYESVWGRELHRVFGTSQFAIATVLAAFMTGLAVGGALGARWAPRLRRPLRAYAALEALIGVYALAFPAIVGVLEPVYLAFHHAVGPSPVVFGAFQFVILGVALLPPTAAMGATLPLLVRFLAEGDRGRGVGTLYAVNTAGAVAGTWLVGFWLLPLFGVHVTTLGAAGANLALAAVAAGVDFARAPAVAAPVTTTGSSAPVLLLLIAGLAGFSSLGLEVAWFRLLTLVLGASTYAFTVMLLAFLVGIALGGEVGGRLSRSPRAALALLGAQLGVAGLAWAATWAWPKLPLLFVALYVGLEPSPSELWAMKAFVAMLVMTPAAVGMGATFPLLARLLDDRVGSTARAVGQVYAANTVGSLLGAFSAGFLLLPAFQVQGTTLLCVCLNLVAAWLAWWWQAGRRALPWLVPLAGAAVALQVVRAPWEPMVMTSGVFKYVDTLDDASEAEFRRKIVDRYQLLWYREGLSTVVTVARNKLTGNIWLANNGKIDASTTTDMPTQILVAHTPMLFTGREARKALLVGLASGITLGALTRHPELEQIDVVELEPSMPDAARFFTKWNRASLDDPRVRLLANDGRNQLLLTPPGTYDVIVSEPSNPWLTGVSNLFTKEFFAMGRTRLAPGGIWAQWVQMYGMDGRDLRAVIRTFCETYPYALLFSTIQDADLVMLGSDRPIEPTAELARALVRKNVGMEADMLEIGVRSEYDLLSHYLFDRDAALALAGDAPLNTDDNLLVEFSAPQNLHRDTSAENFLLLLPHAKAPLSSVPDADGLVALSVAYGDREDYVRALIALKEAERRDPGRADTLVHYQRYQAALVESLAP